MRCTSLTMHISDDGDGDVKGKSSVPANSVKSTPCVSSTNASAVASNTKCILVAWKKI